MSISHPSKRRRLDNAFPQPSFKLPPSTPVRKPAYTTNSIQKKPLLSTPDFGSFKGAFAIPVSPSPAPVAPSPTPKFRTPVLPFTVANSQTPEQRFVRNDTSPKSSFGRHGARLFEELINKPTPSLIRRSVIPAPNISVAHPPTSSPSSQRKTKELSIPPAFPSFLTEEEDEPDELAKGVMPSPEKNEKRKFIKNGLADRVSNLIDRSDTSLSLWSKDMRSRFTTEQLGRGEYDKQTRSVMKVRVLSIVSNIFAPSSKSGSEKESHDQVLRAVLARCQSVSASLPALVNDAPTDTFLMLFRFSTDEVFGSRGPVSKQFGPDCDVIIWGNLSRLSLDGLESQRDKDNILLCHRFLVL